MTKTYKHILIAVTLFPILSFAQTQGSFTDTRDGRTYSSVTYQLNIPHGVIADIDEYGVYANKTSASYEITIDDKTPHQMTWMSQNLNHNVSGSKCYSDPIHDCNEHGRLYQWEAAKSVCPDGWHLPSDDEWYLLAHLYGGVASAGKHLKSTQYGGTNQSLFDIKKPNIFWSSDTLNDKYAWDWKVNFRWEKLQRWKGGKNLYNSIRCVKNYF